MSKKQKLELTWVGKEDRPKLESRILLPEFQKSYPISPTVPPGNLIVFGDNLLALKALEDEYTGKLKCIYIDPPYNTGSAFIHYDDGIEHSLWLQLIQARLEILWTLLSDDGSFWISIDDDEMPYLRVLMDQLFGRDKFIAQNIWQKRYSRENREAIGDVHEYVIVYAKNPADFKNKRNKVPLTEEQAKVYKNPNNDPKGRWRPIPMTAQDGHATAEQYYEVHSPGGVVHTPPEGRCWGISKKTYERLLSEGRIWFGRDRKSQPNVIRYLSEVDGVVPWTWWPSEEVGHTDEAKKEMHALFGRVDAFDTPKPERLMHRILTIATNPGDLVLDSFAGSGTTGAVAHKMGRRWIMIELGEHCHTHIIPRLKKVIDGQDPGGITEAVGWKGGGGFRYYRLAPSLLEKDAWDNLIISKEYNPAMLAEAVCRHMGFTYEPSAEHYWMHGKSSETDFIYVTTATLTSLQLRALSEEVGESRTVLICCKAFTGSADQHANLTLKKIPNAVLRKCEWGRDDYSLNVSNLPEPDDSGEQDIDVSAVEPTTAAAPKSLAKKGRPAKVSAASPNLFDADSEA